MSHSIPIYDNRTVIGHAPNIASAIRFIRKTINVHPQFSVSVWMRPDYMQDILNLPAGFVFSVGYGTKNPK